MQKLNRFVTYIYSYRDSQRDTNVGFAKVSLLLRSSLHLLTLILNQTHLLIHHLKG